MNPQRIAAFSNGQTGGNPAGVVIQDQLPTPKEMQTLAREIGYSETVFAAPIGDQWQVRYYSPEAEVAFCGHATIALGVALGETYHAGTFELNLSQGSISVSAAETPNGWTAELKSPETWSKPLDTALLAQLKSLFGLSDDQLDPRLPATLGFAGNQHAILALRNRADLKNMSYDFNTGLALMQEHDLTTISLLYVEADTVIVSRNAFAIGGVVEDPATGAAAAALGGALVDLNWPSLQGGGAFQIRQGEDMGQPSLLNVTVSGKSGDSVRVAGTARNI
ncbi:PhzF family phenazine biosynthesis protein [Parasedimentitalea huanghaiensis]|uniref:PhzF family phenazine biosynthesis isomerase n=1 Tax=Parasedimentitalea huanghaiensis TaxID=2682100 RepID=A0A6L6WDH7_9RHOB|nr:PhzF family phenazine biosynthesis protein [Zongyanglinia huanghaiensis]MVO15893.1 PhzF family phenazine biosynthesis isomerase [Zongyanglinia huanghaiensis]